MTKQEAFIFYTNMENSVLLNHAKRLVKDYDRYTQQEILGRQINVYGNIENPLFMAKDVAEWLEHSDVSTMLRTIDDDEKILMTNPNNVCGGQNSWFLTENGLYEVFMLSRKPIAEYLAESINLLDEGKITLKEVNVRTRKVAEINKAHAKALREYKKAHNIK